MKKYTVVEAKNKPLNYQAKKTELLLDGNGGVIPSLPASFRSRDNFDVAQKIMSGIVNKATRRA